MLADALPNRLGNRLIAARLAESGKGPETFSPVDRLCLIGRRGIGAQEFEPALRRRTGVKRLEVARLVELANRVFDERASLAGRRNGFERGEIFRYAILVGIWKRKALGILRLRPELAQVRRSSGSCVR